MVGFIDAGEELEEGIDDRLDRAAANIPRAILLLVALALNRVRFTLGAGGRLWRAQHPAGLTHTLIFLGT